ncbi:MBOAT, membrane-bound O-acyltransferase family-domain-containing protein [Dissophora ornata]|nr:MBOAT, membrane-bound O-acyltransferase family-domain-containing protein [Dissophora ornata]
MALLLLFGNNIRLIIENYLKYGFLLSIPGSNVSRNDWILTAITHAVLPFNVLVAYKLEEWAMQLAIGFKKRRSDNVEVTVPNGTTPNGTTPAAVAAGDDVKDVKKGSKKKGAAKKDPKDMTIEEIARANQSIVGWLHVLNLTMIMAWPSLMSFFVIFHPFLAMSCLMNGLVLFLKMTSFALVNQDLRAAYIFDTPVDQCKHLTAVHEVPAPAPAVENKEDNTDDESKSTTTVAKVVPEIYQYDVQYPDNITPKNLAYFWFAPTLCYQPSYPRTTVFRKSFFLKRCLEIVTCLGMMYFLIEQYATPTLQNSVRALDDLAFGTILERLLKLSTTSVIIWLLMFYTFFHSFFNAIAEVLYFGDRCFYLAWWNSARLSEYWRLWNKPVYTFFKRHVYLPMVISGIKPVYATFTIFTISAILHEVLIGIPTHMIYGYAFAGMFFQIPLIAMTDLLPKGSSFGNMIFWVSFTILGQPACALLYYYHWTKLRMDQ